MLVMKPINGADPQPNEERPIVVIRVSDEFSLRRALDSVSVDVVELEFPTNLPDFAFTLGRVLLDKQWKDSPIRELQVRCETQEMFNMVNGYFQGYWHLN